MPKLSLSIWLAAVEVSLAPVTKTTISNTSIAEIYPIYIGPNVLLPGVTASATV